MTAGEIRTQLGQLSDETEVLIYDGCGNFSTIHHIGKNRVTKVKWPTKFISYSAADNMENTRGEVLETKEMPFLVRK